MPDADIQLSRQAADPMSFVMTVEFRDDGIPGRKIFTVYGELLLQKDLQ